MVERKSGPVKPPTLDLKARENAQKTEAGKTETPEESTPSGATDTSANRTGGESGKDKTSDPSQASTGASSSTDRTGTGSSKGQDKKTAETAPGAASGSGPSKSGGAASGSANATTAAASPGSGSKDQKTATGSSESTASSSSTTRASSGGARSGDPAHSAAPQPPLRPHAGVSTTTVVATGIGGAVLGAVLAYGIAAIGYWPGPPDTSAALSQRMDDLEQSVSTAASGFEEVNARVGTVTGDLESRIAGVEDQVATLSEQSGPGEAVAQLSQQVSELQNQVSALEAGASSGEAQQIGSTLSDVQARTDTLAQTQDSLDQRLREVESALADRPDTDALAAERDRFAQWPAAMTALETRIDSGEPFAQELSTLSGIAPDLSVPEAVTRAAGQGVPALDAIRTRFADLIPEILSARPRNPNAPWYQNLLDQAGAALALRPVGDSGGTGPDALVARAESALESDNSGAAREALAALPEPMAQRAQPIIGMLDARIAAETFLETAREQGAGSGQANQEPAA